MLDLRDPPHLPLIAPSILSADFARLGEDAGHILSVGADLLHLDVMDGHFAPNLTMGPALCGCVRNALPDAFLDVHLMVRDPGMFVEPFATSGANHMTFHAEVLIPDHCIDLAATVRQLGMTAGLAINPQTPIEPLAGLLPHFDMILVMSVQPGFSGQAFMPEVLCKTRAVRALLRPNQRLEMDGGITPTNIAGVRDAGCDVIVAATAIFGQPKALRAGVVNALRRP
ncbi:MAG: ribulose-phosphate 3-epimerase [Phycisphaerales bacterium]|nr:ribulose-phosphate 3-epimerase [Phycisphaerales bacterium]